MMDKLPAVSCMCLTYGRPHLLEEAIESFLRQDYQGDKELIVLNDFADQELYFDHPEVHIINVKKRFKTVGEKRNACAALCSHDLLFVWDDDDLYLPWRLSYSIERYDEDARFFKITRAFRLDNEELVGLQGSLFHSASCWHRELFNSVSGYPHIGSGQDLDLEKAMREQNPKVKLRCDDVPLNKIYYIYRWAGTKSYHLSGFGRDKPGEKAGNDKVTQFVQSQIARGVVSTGRIALEPKWKIDYEAAVLEFLRTLDEQG